MTDGCGNGDAELIHNLLGLYCRLVDSHEYARWAQLLTPDAQYVLGQNTIVGNEAIAAWVADADRRAGPQRHLLNNFQINIDGAQAAVSCYVTLLSLASPAAVTVRLAGTYDMELIRLERRWLIRRIALGLS
jgi:hypothetical protein